MHGVYNVKLDKQMYKQQTAVITEYKRSPTTFGYYWQPSSGTINT